MINTVLRNLTTNAIKFTPDGGEIKICATEKENIVEVCVEDSGVGIKEEVIPKLFSVTEKISTTGTSGESGTGLGLVLCKEFINNNGGEIRVESEIGKGSKFYFTLPKSNG